MGGKANLEDFATTMPRELPPDMMPLAEAANLAREGIFRKLGARADGARCASSTCAS